MRWGQLFAVIFIGIGALLAVAKVFVFPDFPLRARHILMVSGILAVLAYLGLFSPRRAHDPRREGSRK